MRETGLPDFVAVKQNRMESLADFLGVKNRELPDHQPVPDPRVRRLSVKERAREILESPEYFQSVVDRIRLGTLPPAVEIRFYDEAYGKPIERVEVKDVTDDVDNMNYEELEREAERLLALARELRVTESADARSVH